MIRYFLTSLLWLYPFTTLAGAGPLMVSSPHFRPINIGTGLCSYGAALTDGVFNGTQFNTFTDLTGSGRTMSCFTSKPNWVLGQDGRPCARWTNAGYATCVPFLLGNNYHVLITTKCYGTGGQELFANGSTNRQGATLSTGQIPTMYDGTSTVTGTAWNTTAAVFTGEWVCTSGTATFFTNAVATGGVAGGTILNAPMAMNSMNNVINVVFATNDLYRIDVFGAPLTGTKLLIMQNFHRRGMFPLKVW